ncbi:EmrB/QacA subfamily drug resistance transporter OS=Streptomyces violarus OX=67380 GN=FHS41_006740 PE=4 SV=1 [Streptomyces violarus]
MGVIFLLMFALPKRPALHAEGEQAATEQKEPALVS